MFDDGLVGRIPGRSNTLVVSTGSTLSLLRTMLANASKSNSIGSATALIVTVLYGSRLWLTVPGMRKTRAASAVTFMSIFSPSCLHRRLKFSATGFHLEIGASSVRGQYTWNPPPESTMNGVPSSSSPVFSRNATNAASPSFFVPYVFSLAFAQSRSTKNERTLTALAAVRAPVFSKDASAK